MKILNKISSLALLLPMFAMLSSCSEDHADYTPAQTVDGPQVFFHSSNATKLSVTDAENAFTIQLNRLESTESANYILKIEGEEDALKLFNIPSVAVFEGNATSTTLSCVANTQEMEYDKEYVVSISLSDEISTPYGSSSLKLAITRPAPWKSLGKGKFSEAFLGEAGVYSDVEIQQNDLEPNKFRLVDPYWEILGDIAVDKYLEFVILPKGYDFKGTILDAEYVIFNDYNTGQWNSNYEYDIYALHPYRFGMTLDKWAYNVVMEYQENGLPGEVSLAPYFYIFELNGGWNNTTSNTISILFPGYVKADYSASLEYAGIFTDKEGKVYATGMLDLGPDATDVKAIVMPADADAAAVADAIAAGELEGTEVKAGRIEIPFNAEELGGNNFQIIAVVMSEGAVKTIATTNFEYFGGGKNPWQSIGKGYYTDDILSSGWGLPPVTYEVEILEHDENPGLYRLVNPYNNKVYPAEYTQLFAEELGNSLAPEGYNLEVNAMDVEGVYIQPQALGLDFGDGEWAFATMGGFYLANDNPFDMVKEYGYLGSVVEGVIKFPVLGYKDQQGEVRAYQGVYYEGANGPYYSALNGKVEIVLPGANAFARNMAKAKANSTKRGTIKKSCSGIKVDNKRINPLNRTIDAYATPNF